MVAEAGQVDLPLSNDCLAAVGPADEAARVLGREAHDAQVVASLDAAAARLEAVGQRAFFLTDGEADIVVEAQFLAVAVPCHCSIRQRQARSDFEED